MRKGVILNRFNLSRVARPIRARALLRSPIRDGGGKGSPSRVPVRPVARHAATVRTVTGSPRPFRKRRRQVRTGSPRTVTQPPAVPFSDSGRVRARVRRPRVPVPSVWRVTRQRFGTVTGSER